MKITKKGYLHTFAFVTVILALVRCYNDSSFCKSDDVFVDSISEVDSIPPKVDSLAEITYVKSDAMNNKEIASLPADFKPHRILSVPSFKYAFPDSNDVQLISAKKYGVTPVADRNDAERRKSELVYAAANPYFHVDKLRESVPYLVPRANNLLQEIGKAFYDSLYVKGVPLHQIIVTSVLRTEEDVVRLRKHNGNASENSCHRFGTTFDICYNRYITVQTKDQPRRKVTNDTLKWVLSEVLRDKREAGRCYVKYEVKQGCFHITVR